MAPRSPKKPTFGTTASCVLVSLEAWPFDNHTHREQTISTKVRILLVDILTIPNLQGKLHQLIADSLANGAHGPTEETVLEPDMIENRKVIRERSVLARTHVLDPSTRLGYAREAIILRRKA
jgi:hypothetical protein